MNPERTETESMRKGRKNIPTPARSRSVFETLCRRTGSVNTLHALLPVNQSTRDGAHACAHTHARARDKEPPHTPQTQASPADNLPPGTRAWPRLRGFQAQSTCRGWFEEEEDEEEDDEEEED